MAIDSAAKRRNVANITIRYPGSLSPSGSVVENDQKNGILVYIGFEYSEIIDDGAAVLYGNHLAVMCGVFV